MADLTLPASIYPITAGDALNGDDIMTLFHDTANPENSLEVINGFLDYNNLAASWSVGAQYTQRGSAIEARQVSRTANLDWMWHHWGSEQTTGGTLTLSAATPFQYIPGANIQWFQKWTGMAVVSWTIMWANDSYSTDDDRKSLLYLFFDNVAQTAQRRGIGRCLQSWSDPLFYKRARVWSGHMLLDSVSRGWHSAGLTIICDNRVRQTRTWASSFRVVPFKYPG